MLYESCGYAGSISKTPRGVCIPLMKCARIMNGDARENTCEPESFLSRIIKTMNIVVIAHNIRSTHNIGSILRTSDGFGITKVYCTGYTPYPTLPGDKRLPHISKKLTAQIHKTALGAEVTVPLEHSEEVESLLKSLGADGYQIVALEQSPESIMLPSFIPSRDKLALLLGEEVHGITNDLLKLCDIYLEIPMQGKKESFNVSVATGIALYALSTPNRS
jgi:23S rRNA (guanosine2251-2'-O)-methyltransferase